MNARLIPVLHNQIIGHVCMLRDLDVSQEEDPNFTIAEAMLATLASPPLFTPASIPTVEYIGGDPKFSNPTLTIVSEAYKVFGEDVCLACLMNLGCSHPGFLSPPSSSDLNSWKEFLDKYQICTKKKWRPRQFISNKVPNSLPHHPFNTFSSNLRRLAVWRFHWMKECQHIDPKP
jgi:hypothetical protein